MKSVAAIAFAAFALALGICEPAVARERVHYIAADEVIWNYAPLRMNPIDGSKLPPLLPTQLGWTYRKAFYREYTDASFTRLASISPSDRYLGIVGPVIHAEVGDTVVVVFRNRTRLPLDIAPGGLRSIPKPSAVSPGATRTFRWPIGDADGPGGQDGSSVLFVYESDVNQTADESLGLIGPLIVTRRGQARADGSPIDVDREMVALFSVQDEFQDPFLSLNLANPAINPRHFTGHEKTFENDNYIHTINGFAWGNMPTPTIRMGERVRWYMLSTSTPADGHIPVWSGQTVLSQGNRSDSIQLVTPHMIADMVPDNPGVWLLVCTLNIHLMNGMEARYKVVK
ncbi:MAG TPA: multicopper oxidase domain-containing protein [Candidatus Eremiobacteraceae bacterium]|nr:multicopper oxidase domain-containing protein [Candidatus Eremiobacteraceae bacterium]